MSEAISKRIKQLENQNEKLRKLLRCTLQITSEQSAKCLHLESEASSLKRVLSDLENQKQHLENELTLHLERDYWIPDETLKKVNIQSKLNKALNDLETTSSEIQNLDIDNEYIKELIDELEREKQILLHDIKLVQKADEDNNILAEENRKLKEELTLLQSQVSNKISPSSSIEDLIQKLADIEDAKQKLQDDMASASKTSDPLGIPVENTVLELKISGLDMQKADILKHLKTRLLQSANEVSMLHGKTSDGQLRGLMNELNLHKTILMMNLNEVKEMHLEEKIDIRNSHEEMLDETEDPSEAIKRDLINSLNEKIDDKQENDLGVAQPEEFSTPPGISNEDADRPIHSAEIIQKISEIRNSEPSPDLATVSEEDEVVANELLVEHEHLVQELKRLEGERDDLLEQIQKVNRLKENASGRNALHQTFMKEESSEELQRLPLDDATNQMYVNEEQMLAQRIRELEEDNERIRRNLGLMMREKGDLETLDGGEKVAK